jgi:hypothetical protein
VLRQRYIEARTQDLTRPGVDPGAARAQAESEVALHAGAQRWELTDTALGVQTQFQYLQQRHALPAVADLDLEGLGVAVRDTNAGRALTAAEHQALITAVRDWQPGSTVWATSEGEMFPALVAHTLGVRLRNVIASGVQDVGPTGGRTIAVRYNGHNHYDATIQTSQQKPQPDQTPHNIAAIRGGPDTTLTVSLRGYIFSVGGHTNRIYVGIGRKGQSVRAHIAEGGVVTIHEATTGAKLGEVTLKPDHKYYSIAASRHAPDRTLKINSLGRILLRVGGHQNTIYISTAREDENVVVHVADEGVVTIHEATTGAWLGEVTLEPGKTFYSIAASRHGPDRTLKASSSGRISLSVDGHQNTISVGSDRAGETLTVHLADEGVVTIRDAATGELVRRVTLQPGRTSYPLAGRRDRPVKAVAGEGASLSVGRRSSRLARGLHEVAASRAGSSSSDGVVPKQEPTPPRFSLPPDTWVEGDGLNQAQTGFGLYRAAVFNVDTNEWEWKPALDGLGQIHTLVVGHRMEPIARNDQLFPLRDPADPLGRVHPDFADAQGNISPNVRVLEVSARFVPSDVGLKSTADREFRDLAAEVETELGQSISNSRAGAHQAPTFLSGRTVTRRLTEHDGLPAHEQVLIGQYGLFVRHEVSAWQVQAPRGHILGIYMGALLRTRAQEAQVEAVLPAYADYLMRGGPRSNYSGLGATNGVAFANTPLLPGARGYDQNRVNADFLGFKVKLTDKNGKARSEVIAVLVGRRTLGPGQQILVSYGKDYLPQFRQKKPPTQIKPEPQ